MKKNKSYLVVSELLGFSMYRHHHAKYPATDAQFLGMEVNKSTAKNIILRSEPLTDKIDPVSVGAAKVPGFGY